MANLVLYRKYRPKTFGEVIGQEHIVQTLTNALLSGIISHAYLFSGPRGSGKTTIARLLAKSLNCSGRKANSFEPCNECSSCLEIMENRSMDLIEIDAASHRGIDEIRELRDGIKFAPTKSKYKVFILDEAHQLSKDAANALLKTLEEPPSHAIFILATTEIHKMIPTIISRCQRFDFRKLTLAEIIKRLEIVAGKEKVKVEKPALELIALNAGGSIRDAESIFGQVLSFGAGRDGGVTTLEVKDLLGLVELNLVVQFSDLLARKKAKEAINFVNEIVEKGTDLQEFIKSLVNYLRQILIFKITGPEDSNTELRDGEERVKMRTLSSSPPIITGLTKDEIGKLGEQAQSFKEEELQQLLNLFLEAGNKMKYSAIIQLPLELAIIEYCGIA
ncbi:MAG: DNA polymerase III subunit gamma/tau [bacterium]|nr:DNA polymerase III subunit gamma/tau [bacterium]